MHVLWKLKNSKLSVHVISQVWMQSRNIIAVFECKLLQLNLALRAFFIKGILILKPIEPGRDLRYLHCLLRSNKSIIMKNFQQFEFFKTIAMKIDLYGKMFSKINARPGMWTQVANLTCYPHTTKLLIGHWRNPLNLIIKGFGRKDPLSAQNIRRVQ